MRNKSNIFLLDFAIVLSLAEENFMNSNKIKYTFMDEGGWLSNITKQTNYCIKSCPKYKLCAPYLMRWTREKHFVRKFTSYKLI